MEEEELLGVVIRGGPFKETALGQYIEWLEGLSWIIMAESFSVKVQSPWVRKPDLDAFQKWCFLLCHQMHFSLWEWPCKVQSSTLIITHCCFNSSSIHHQAQSKALHPALMCTSEPFFFFFSFPSSNLSIASMQAWACMLARCRLKGCCDQKAPHSESGSSHLCN